MVDVLRTVESSAGKDHHNIFSGKRMVEDDLFFRSVCLDQFSGDGLADCQLSAQTVEQQRIALLDCLVIRRIGKQERNDTEVDQIGAVDTLNGKSRNHFNTQIHRADGGVFSAGTLSVTVASDDDTGFARIADRCGAFGK